MLRSCAKQWEFLNSNRLKAQRRVGQVKWFRAVSIAQDSAVVPMSGSWTNLVR
jgi:hypothetical protein